MSCLDSFCKTFTLPSLGPKSAAINRCNFEGIFGAEDVNCL